MNKKTATLISIFLSAISIQSYACGVPPSAPFIGNCSSFTTWEAYSDCHNSNDAAIRSYEQDLAEWERCEMNDPWYGGSEPQDPEGHWEDRQVTICTTQNIPVYGGHDWFRGERKSIQNGVYDPGNGGSPCDDIFVTESLNQFIDYYDYDGVSQCEAYLGAPIRIDVKETCKISTYKVFIPSH